MKMQDRIEELATDLGVQREKLRAARGTIDGISDEALAISEIEAVVEERLRRTGYLNTSQDPVNQRALTRVFVYVAERHGVELIRNGGTLT